MAEEEDLQEGAMAASQEDAEISFSFMDKVKFMMYGEQEKEAFLIEKKEKEEKKKAKKKLKEQQQKKKAPSSSGKVEEEATGEHPSPSDAVPQRNTS